jgi:hypothetical protein
VDISLGVGCEGLMSAHSISGRRTRRDAVRRGSTNAVDEVADAAAGGLRQSRLRRSSKDSYGELRATDRSS